MLNAIPEMRLPPIFPGQMGVPFSDVPLGIRTLPRSITLYVDHGHPNANDSNDGTNPDAPMDTVQAAVTRLNNNIFGQTYNTIIVRRMGAESVQTGVYGVAPSSVRIIGVGDKKSFMGVYWEGGGDGYCLDLRAPGWHVEGFRFGPSVGESGIRLPMTGAPGVHVDAIPIFTSIENCWFYGANAAPGDGLYGIEMFGGAYTPTIKNCVFEFFARAGAAAIAVTDSSFALPYRVHIEKCLFRENVGHIDCVIGANRGFNSSEIINSVFSGRAAQPGASLTNQVTGKAIDLTGGAGNFVCGNYFGGIYRSAGNGDYDAGTNDFWVGNYTNPATANAGTCGDNGITVAVPS